MTARTASVAGLLQRVKALVERCDRKAYLERHLRGRSGRKLRLPERVLNAQETEAFEQLIANSTHRSSPTFNGLDNLSVGAGRTGPGTPGPGTAGGAL